MATPNPERELTRLARALDADGAPRLIVVTGLSAFFRNEAFERALAAVPDDADVRRVDGSDDTDGRELDDLRGGALFGSGSWLCVRRGDGWLKVHAEPLQRTLKDGIAAGCGLIVECQKLDKRTKLAKALAAGGAVFEFRELYAEPYDRSRSPLEAELVGWLRDRARARRVPLTAEAAFLLVSTVGKNPAELLAEVDRVGVGLPEGERAVGPDELRGRLSVGFESTPFEFADAVLAFDRRRALRSLQSMFARGVRGRDGRDLDAGGVFPFVASWLHQSFVNVYLGRGLYDAGVRPDEIAPRLGVRVFVDRFVAQVTRNPMPRLRRGIEALLSAQRELRLSGESPELLLERFVSRYFAETAA